MHVKISFGLLHLHIGNPNLLVAQWKISTVTGCGGERERERESRGKRKRDRERERREGGRMGKREKKIER